MKASCVLGLYLSSWQSPQVSSGAFLLLGNGNKRALRYGGPRKTKMSCFPVEPEAVNTRGLTRSWISEAQTSGGPGFTTPPQTLRSFWRVFFVFVFALFIFVLNPSGLSWTYRFLTWPIFIDQSDVPIYFQVNQGDLPPAQCLIYIWAGLICPLSQDIKLPL